MAPAVVPYYRLHSCAFARRNGVGPSLDEVGEAVPIYRFLKDSEFGPEDIKAIAAAYERACEELKLTGDQEPMKQLVAKRVLAIVQTGEREPHWIADRVVRELSGASAKPK